MKQYYSAFSSGAVLLGALSWGTTALAATFTADISANLVRPSVGTGSVFYSQENDLPPPPGARAFGSVSNSLGEVDVPSDASNSPSVLETYGDAVTWGTGSAQSSVGDAFTFPSGTAGVTASAWGGASVSAALDLDVSSAPLGSSVEGYANAGVSGYSYDGSDSSGINLRYTFNVDFSINAIVSAGAGSSVDGAVGIQIDAFNFSTGDLTPAGFTPRVSGGAIQGFVDMVEEQRLDQLGDAWTFAISTEEIVANGGNLDENYTAEFDFFIPNDPGSANAIYLTIDAFALGEVATVPIPASMVFLGTALLGIGVLGQRRRRSVTA